MACSLGDLIGGAGFRSQSPAGLSGALQNGGNSDCNRPKIEDYSLIAFT